MTTPSSDARSIISGGFEIRFRVTPSLNYALYHCRVPIIHDLVITNMESQESPAVALLFTVPGYIRPWKRELQSIPPGECVRIGTVPLEVIYERLEGLEGKRFADLVIKVNDEQIHAEELAILGFYEWSLHKRARKSLACFVQPAHPLVCKIVADTDYRLEKESPSSSLQKLLDEPGEKRAHLVLEALYETLSKGYNIRYVKEAPSYELDSQAIRPPHRIIPNSARRSGVGTCLDLTLLLASCLENLHLQPLVLLVQQNETQQGRHAVAGCWSRVGERFEPLIACKKTIQEQLERGALILLESTGMTDRWVKKLSYREAVIGAENQIDAAAFLFALDLAAARQTVGPLQFPMSPGAIDIQRMAEKIARAEQSSRLETKHLLLALLLYSNHDIRQLLEEAGADLSPTGVPREQAPQPLSMLHRATINYRRCLDDARLVAGDVGFGFVEEEHLLFALLLSQSKEVDRVLQSFKTDRDRLLDVFTAAYTWTRDVEQTICDS